MAPLPGHRRPSMRVHCSEQMHDIHLCLICRMGVQSQRGGCVCCGRGVHGRNSDGSWHRNRLCTTLISAGFCSCGTALRRFTGAINRINSHVQGYVEAHSKGRIKFVDCRSFFLSESEDIDEDLMPDSAYPNASGGIGAFSPAVIFLRKCTWVLFPGSIVLQQASTACPGHWQGCLTCHVIAR